MRVAASLSSVSPPPSNDALRRLLSLSPVSPFPLPRVACSKAEEEREERGHDGLVLLDNGCDKRRRSSSPSTCKQERPYWTLPSPTGSLRRSPPPSRPHPRSSPHRNPSRLPRSTLDGKTHKMGVGMHVAEGRTMGYGQRCSS